MSDNNNTVRKTFGDLRPKKKPEHPIYKRVVKREKATKRRKNIDGGNKKIETANINILNSKTSNYNEEIQKQNFKFQYYNFSPFTKEASDDFLIIAPLLLIDQWEDN